MMDFMTHGRTPIMKSTDERGIPLSLAEAERMKPTNGIPEFLADAERMAIAREPAPKRGRGRPKKGQSTTDEDELHLKLFLTRAEVARILGIGISRTYDLRERDKDFPPACLIGGAVRWPTTAVLIYCRILEKRAIDDAAKREAELAAYARDNATA
ncbi:helix-turn-helix transcriptional regulator [Cupriavidus metallidurans]|uniref:helix-turn-helix transcriptional regulator n=1 Tax=Cupriavidus metallidurans TaxID=119219 RepID=UPI001644D4D4|nr:hypothetical protein [Cupriavidus metallidurans]